MSIRKYKKITSELVDVTPKTEDGENDLEQDPMQQYFAQLKEKTFEELEELAKDLNIDLGRTSTAPGAFDKISKYLLEQDEKLRESPENLEDVDEDGDNFQQD